MASAAASGTGKEYKVHMFSGRRRADPAGGTDFFDYSLLAVIVLLTGFGLIMQYSVTAYDVLSGASDSKTFIKQALIAVASLVLLLAVARVNYHWLAAKSFWLYVIANILLIATYFVGIEVNGAKRWLGYGSLRFQPAEVAKVAVILFLPVLIISSGRKFKKRLTALKVAMCGFISAILTYVFTDNLSTAMIIAGITFALMVISYPKPKAMVLVFFLALAAAAIFYAANRGNSFTNSTGSFRISRIAVWLDPEDNQKDGGYQVMQGLYAIGSGGLFGKGLGNSSQKLGALPEAQNDMIFAIICEELGIVGAALVILLYVYMLFRLFAIAVNAPDLEGSLIAVGIFAHVAIQVILNIAVVLNVIPTTGISLPFISQGGTSILFLMIEMGIALNISSQIEAK